MRGLIAAGACLLVLAVVLVVAAKGNVAGETDQVAFGDVDPMTLPREEPAPASLTLGFDSHAPAGKPTPALKRIEFAIADRVRLDGRGLRSCPLGDLYTDAPEPCPRSMIGFGLVSSEIAPPGEQAVAAQGRVTAFYNRSHRQQRVLARVTTGAPLDLVYVIPFSVEPVARGHGTRLVVHARRMRNIVGKCVADHPDCLSDPYGLHGGYEHIAHLEMTLGRQFRAGGELRGFVESRCPARRPGGRATVPLLRATLTYADGSTASDTVESECRVES